MAFKWHNNQASVGGIFVFKIERSAVDTSKWTWHEEANAWSDNKDHASRAEAKAAVDLWLRITMRQVLKEMGYGTGKGL